MVLPLMSIGQHDMVGHSGNMAASSSLRVLTEQIIKSRSSVSPVINGFNSPGMSAKSRIPKTKGHEAAMNLLKDRLVREQTKWREAERRISTSSQRLYHKQLCMVGAHAQAFVQTTNQSVESDVDMKSEIAHQLSTRLKTFERFTEEDLTESSSDEEIEREDHSEIRRRFRRTTAKYQWEQHKASLRSRWAVVRSRLAEIDRRLSALPPSTQNKDVSKETDFQYDQHHPNGVDPMTIGVGTALWSKLYMDESSTSARTRQLAPSLQRPQVYRRTAPQSTRKTEPLFCDHSYHKDLSTTSDLSASLFIEDALHTVTQEPNILSTARSRRRDKKSGKILSLSLNQKRKSGSPNDTTPPSSLIGTPYDERRERALKKRSQSLSSPLTSPTSSRPGTPSLKRKKNVTEFSIDNFVVPDVPFTPRLEKLEYKEIVTPSWREYSGVRTESEAVNSNEDIEDICTERYVERHNRCEEKEKKRFVSFLTSGRKRRANSGQHVTTGTACECPLNGTGGSESAKFGRKKRSSSGSTSLVSSPAEIPESFILPWPPRNFPLSVRDMKELDNPSSPPKLSDISVPRSVASAWGLVSPVTPSPTTPKGAVPMPTSPEWMVNSQNEIGSQNVTPLVLKLTKRS